jgi:2-desacetyl-2-hydroxyethyl bacteriochlorophyllide A dehydrogenase
MAKMNRMAMLYTPGRAELVQKEIPRPGETQVLIAVKAASVCGGDLHIYKGKHPSAPPPVALGHELAGEVVEIGAKVKAIKVGDRVTVEPVIACGECPPCRRGEYGYCDNLSYAYRRGQGAMADYFVADERYTYKLPEGMAYEAGTLIEPLAVAVHAVKRAKIGLGERVVVIGAGPIGILVCAVCRAAGAKEIIVSDIAEARLQMALAMGATRAVNSQQESLLDVVREITGGRGVNRSIECVGSEKTFEQAMRCLAKGGIATNIGIFEQPTIQVPATLFVSQEITVQGAQGYCWDFETALALAGAIDLGKLVSHVFPLEKVDEAIQTALNREAKPVKIVLNP